MDISGLITVVVVLAVVGLCLYLLLKYVPMEPPFPTIIIAVVAIVLILWLLNTFVTGGSHLRVRQ